MHIHGTEASIDRDFRRFGFTRHGAPRQDIEDVEDFRFNMLEAFTRDHPRAWTSGPPWRRWRWRGPIRWWSTARRRRRRCGRSRPSWSRAVGEGGGQVQTIPGLTEAFRHCAEHNQMLHESGQLGFTAPAGRLDLAGYDHFAGPHPETRPADN